MMAEFTLDTFIAEMETQLLEDALEITLDTLFALLVGGKAGYHVMKA
jgi:hypothetical protein